MTPRVKVDSLLKDEHYEGLSLFPHNHHEGLNGGRSSVYGIVPNVNGIKPCLSRAVRRRRNDQGHRMHMTSNFRARRNFPEEHRDLVPKEWKLNLLAD